ncbi:MAG: hypothetical protein ACFFD8_07085 [Candidatus Thorarchaeota archaeon]
MSEGLRKVVGLIPKDHREPVSTALLDLLLKTKATKSVPAREAKMILHLMMRDLTATDMGLETLFTSALRAEPVKTLDLIGDVLGGIMAKEEVIKALSTLTVTQ